MGLTDDEHSTTRTLKRVSPFWSWVRGNPSLVIGGLGIIISGAVTWHDLKTRMGTIETKVDELAKKPPAVTAEEFAELRNRVAQQEGRWQQVDSVPQLTGSRRAQHK